MIQIICQNERYTYDMYHIVKSFFPDAVINQTVDAEQESLIQIRVDGDSCFCCQANDEEVRGTFLGSNEPGIFTVEPSETDPIAHKREKKRYINKKLIK